MPRHDRLYLYDIVEAAEVLERIVMRYSFDEATADEFISSTIIQKFIVIGEACSRISQELKTRYPEMSWRQAIAFRNIMVHRYFSIEWSIVWNAATEVLPGFTNQVRSILAIEFPVDSADPG
jgi:uncharacterized protein with HEPN domain